MLGRCTCPELLHSPIYPATARVTMPAQMGKIEYAIFDMDGLLGK